VQCRLVRFRKFGRSVLDLARTPPCENSSGQTNSTEQTYPLQPAVCQDCLAATLPALIPPRNLHRVRVTLVLYSPTAGYGTRKLCRTGDRPARTGLGLVHGQVARQTTATCWRPRGRRAGIDRAWVTIRSTQSSMSGRKKHQCELGRAGRHRKPAAFLTDESSGRGNTSSTSKDLPADLVVPKTSTHHVPGPARAFQPTLRRVSPLAYDGGLSIGRASRTEP